MRKLPYVIYGVMALLLVALFAMELVPDGKIETDTLVRLGLMTATLCVAIVRTVSGSRGSVANRKTVYKNAYEAFLGTAFSWDSKLEKQLYKAIDDLNNGKQAAALKKLEKLRAECRGSGDVFAVTVFQGLCYDDLKLYDKAIECYYAAQQIKPTGTVASNMGLCHHNLGHTEQAVACYEEAIRLDPANAFPLSNLAQLYIRNGEYETAGQYAERALQIDSKMSQALSAMAIVCAMQDDQEGYESYYRRAVANGADGGNLKTAIAILRVANKA